MNLYATHRKKELLLSSKGSYSVYLESLAKERPEFDHNFKYVTSIVNHENNDKKLYVVSASGHFYLCNEFDVSEGISNILFCSSNFKRLMGYGEILIKQL